MRRSQLNSSMILSVLEYHLLSWRCLRKGANLQRWAWSFLDWVPGVIVVVNWRFHQLDFQWQDFQWQDMDMNGGPGVVKACHRKVCARGEGDFVLVSRKHWTTIRRAIFRRLEWRYFLIIVILNFTTWADRNDRHALFVEDVEDAESLRAKSLI